MLDKAHQIFLQACANHGILKPSDANEILSKIYEEDDYDIEEIISEINKKIKAYDQQIKFVKCDILEIDFIVFINTAESDINKFQSHYSESDRNYFRAIINEIIFEENYCIRPIIAVNLANHIKGNKFNKNRAEQLLQEWWDLGYFVEKDDLIYFGPKLVAEFGTYLRVHYPDKINVCSLCQNVLFRSISCQSCNSLFHRDCMRKYLIKMSKCPSCQKFWNQPLTQ